MYLGYKVPYCLCCEDVIQMGSVEGSSQHGVALFRLQKAGDVFNV